MSNLNNLQARLVSLTKSLTNAKNQQEREDIEDMIADIEDEIEGIMQDQYETKHGAQWQ